MLMYATIFLASFIVAVVALVLYRRMSFSSGSVYTSRAPVVITKQPKGDQANKAAGSAVTRSRPVRAPNRNVTPENHTRPYPATCLDDVNLGWEVGRNRVSEPSLSYAGAGKVSRCSLYDVSTPESSSGNKRNLDWSFGEEKRAPGANVHKAPRKVAATPSDPETSAKPWGW